ncbi:VanZ family protein [Priestia megaterium]|uniref:VanZ family protein n=1 Tax=Priestia megaterium TaxID=1404 RepID=UPI00355B787F
MLKGKLISCLFLSSILFILYLTMFPKSSLGIGVNRGDINLIPFHMIKYLFYHHSFIGFIINTFGNLILFIPFGFVLTFKFRWVNNVFKVLLIGMLLSSCIECVQLFMPNRWTDIDDVILNTLGTGIGYIIFKTLNKFYKIT